MSTQVVKVDIIDNYPDWMSKASARLWNTRLCDLPLPGSHDAGAFGNIAERSKAQGVDIKRQLECGFRYFDFRVCVDNGVFYAVHGEDSTNNNYCAIPSRRQDALKDNPKGFVFDEIRNFANSYTSELLILHFSHFVGKGSQRFNADDEKDFSDQIRAYFEPLLVPRAQGPTTTYGACISGGKRIVAIVDDDSTWWTSKNSNVLIWSAKDCFRDRYSDKYYDITGGAAVNNLDAKMEYTLNDQENYLTLGGSDHRDPNKFWVSQAVLNYSAVPYDGHSQNYHGAKVMNPKFIAAYRNWFQGCRSDGTRDTNLAKPNVLLMDYAGYFGGPRMNDPLHVL